MPKSAFFSSITGSVKPGSGRHRACCITKETIYFPFDQRERNHYGMISSFGSGRAWRYYRRIVLIALDQGMSRIVLTLICGPVWRAVGDKSWCQVLVILAGFRHADREGWCQNELPWLPWKSFSICLSMSSSLSFFTLHSFPLRLPLSLPLLPPSLRWTTPHPFPHSLSLSPPTDSCLGRLFHPVRSTESLLSRLWKSFN